jgi:hypothetical protein
MVILGKIPKVIKIGKFPIAYHLASAKIMFRLVYEVSISYEVKIIIIRVGFLCINSKC